MTTEREIREAFEALHPGVQVQFEMIPGQDGQYAPKLLMMHVAGSMPDVIHLDASSAAIFIDNGVLRDLSPMIARDPDFCIEDYFESVVAIARRDEPFGDPAQEVGRSFPGAPGPASSRQRQAGKMPVLRSAGFQPAGRLAMPPSYRRLPAAPSYRQFPTGKQEQARCLRYVPPASNRTLVPPASGRHAQRLVSSQQPQAPADADNAISSSGRLYAIPLDFTPMVIYYNKTLFDDAGVPYPTDGWTWDDFLAAAKALTIMPDGADRPTQYGFNFINWMPAWILWLWTNNADVLDESGRRATGAFDAPRSIEAIHFIVNLMTKHHVAPTLTESSAAGVDLFRAGRAAMDLKGHWMMIDYRADGIDFGVVSLPTNTGEPVTAVYAAGLAITEKARHPGLAWEYVKFMTSKRVQIRRVAPGLAISANRHAAAHYADNPIEQAFLRQVPHARPPWGARVERYPVVEDLGREMMEDILYGNVPVGDAIKRTTRLIDAALAEP
jgi:ABC-type glycerol-3-phosphate transport system substrate-binding protein